jgi:hypothetical protein
MRNDRLLYSEVDKEVKNFTSLVAVEDWTLVRASALLRC